MKAIQNGNMFQIYDDGLKTYDALPADTYSVRFAKMTGFYLEKHLPLEIGEKVYGVHEAKVAKVMHTFQVSDRNLGVILSGAKGIGKSIFAKMMGQACVAAGIPVIIVDHFYPGISAFLESIEQEVMVLFDEFDKTFGSIKTGDNEPDAQAGLLSLFDGMAAGKKLFVVTCNDLNGLNDFLVNRPGRFHYHLRFDYPNPAEIEEYLKDKLVTNQIPEISNVVAFAKRVPLNYDCLRAIATELNFGQTFKEAIGDLNIVNTSNQKYDLYLHYAGGETLANKNVCLDMFSTDEDELWLSNRRGECPVQVMFRPADFVYDAARGIMTLEASQFSLSYDKSEPDAKRLRAMTPLAMTAKRVATHDIHYAV